MTLPKKKKREKKKERKKYCNDRICVSEVMINKPHMTCYQYPISCLCADRES